MEEGSKDEGQPPATVPENVPITLQGFATDELARRFNDVVYAYVRELSRYIDLKNLDGITIASDYEKALRDLDRGYSATQQLEPSDGIAIGVAMTPAVLRDGKLKSHMLFRTEVLLPLEDQAHERFQLAFHMLAHECAHVEVTDRFDEAFPNMLLRSRAPNMHVHARNQIIKACWDEFAVTWTCARYGHDPTADYEETFLEALRMTRSKANELIRAYRRHANVQQIMGEVYGAYGELMKFACYQLGNVAGRGLTLDDLPNTTAALENHWFKPHLDRLDAACTSIAEDYGRWKDLAKFEVIGDIADDVVREGGLTCSNFASDGSFYVNIPFTPETT